MLCIPSIPCISCILYHGHDIIDITAVLTVRGIAPEVESVSDDVGALTMCSDHVLITKSEGILWFVMFVLDL